MKKKKFIKTITSQEFTPFHTEPQMKDAAAYLLVCDTQDAVKARFMNTTSA